MGDLGSIPGLGRSLGEGSGYPLQYSGLENSMDCIVHGVTKSQYLKQDKEEGAVFEAKQTAYEGPPGAGTERRGVRHQECKVMMKRQEGRSSRQFFP